MGAGVSVVKDPPTIHEEEMSCGNCAVRFSVLKRKKYCDECKLTYCAACAQKVPSQSVRRCDRCNTLISGNYNREDLSDYKAKELKQFLTKRQVAVHNCTEKSDFIDLIMQYSNNTQYRAEQAERERHVQALQERMRMNMSPPASAPVPRPPAYSTIYNNSDHTPSTHSASINTNTSQPHTAVPPQQQQQQQHNDTNTEESMSHSGSVHSLHEAADQQQQRESEDTSTQSADTSRGGNAVEEVNSNQSATEGTSNEPKSRFMKLSQIHNIDEINDLTTRQLKEILAGNFVDFKGCVEKQELVQKVHRLWKENQANKSVAEDIHEQGEVSLGETELCKVCMDNVVDCVLLECGHMLTCTQCGKQLAECPICRQYVVRVVHVFKS